jgi:hypothetical protein
MGTINIHKSHALSMHERIKSKLKSKHKGKGKKDLDPRKGGNLKPSVDSAISKEGKGKQGKSKCGYFNHGYHPKSYLMKKTIEIMEKTLQQNNVGDYIPENAKKKPIEKALENQGNVNALIAINYSQNAWIIDLGASHHMENTQYFLSCLKTCMGPRILMGDDSPVEVFGQGRVELINGSFENILHITKIFVNILFVYQITHIGTRKGVEFTSEFHDNI